MKRRLILILLLSVVAAAILVWLYGVASDPASGRRRSSWDDIIADLDACARRKHIRALQYEHFADIAISEQRQEAGRLFRALAFSERLQEQNCVKAIQRLGGSYTTPQQIHLFGGSTDGNLERSIGVERRSFEKRNGAEIRRALDRGNRYAARILIWASATDLRNIFLMECRNSVDDQSFAVCPVCGNIYASKYLDRYCPHCLTAGEQFIRFE